MTDGPNFHEIATPAEVEEDRQWKARNLELLTRAQALVQSSDPADSIMAWALLDRHSQFEVMRLDWKLGVFRRHGYATPQRAA